MYVKHCYCSDNTLNSGVSTKSPFGNGAFPVELKKYIVSPIYKSGETGL